MCGLSQISTDYCRELISDNPSEQRIMQVSYHKQRIYIILMKKRDSFGDEKDEL